MLSCGDTFVCDKVYDVDDDDDMRSEIYKLNDRFVWRLGPPKLSERNEQAQRYSLFRSAV